MKKLDSEVAASSKDSQRIRRSDEKMSCLVAMAPRTQERGDLWMDHHSARVACQCLLNLWTKTKRQTKNVDADQTRTRRPVSGQSLFTQVEEIDIDFRVPGLSHEVVKEAENLRVRELVKKIESHPHREALQGVV